MTSLQDIVETAASTADEEEESVDMIQEDVEVTDILYSLLTTDEDESITNVLKGIRDGIEKQNKILFKIMSALSNR